MIYFNRIMSERRKDVESYGYKPSLGVYAILSPLKRCEKKQIALIYSDLAVRFLVQAETERNTSFMRINRELSTELSELKSEKLLLFTRLLSQ